MAVLLLASEPICPGAWWHLIDPSKASEADPELPLRWAV